MPRSRPTVDAPSEAAVRRQLDRIVEGDAFQAPERLRSLLGYVVEEELAGRGGEISQYAIALEVLGRGNRFDPTEDPIVRIEAGKLRRALEHYFLTAGREDAVRIDVPKGGYRPRFSWQRAAPGAAVGGDTRPALLIGNLDADGALGSFASAVGEEIGVVLASFPHLRVLSPGGPTEATHRVEGSVRRQGDELRVTLRLLDAARGLHLWADVLEAPLDAAPARLGAVLAVRIGDLDGALGRFVADSLPPRPGGVYEATTALQRHFRTLTPDSFELARTTAEEAQRHVPDSPEVLAVLADVYRGGFAHGFTSDPGAPERGLAFATRAVSLGPDLPSPRLALGYARLHFGEPDRAVEEAEAALGAGARSASVRGDAGVLITLAGAAERGIPLVESAVEVLEQFPGWFQHAFFLAAYASGDYVRAYETARRIRMPGLLWDPLDRAASLGMLGEAARARRALEELCVMRPDFAADPRRYLECFVPFEEIVEALLVGLEKGGLTPPQGLSDGALSGRRRRGRGGGSGARRAPSSSSPIR